MSQKFGQDEMIDYLLVGIPILDYLLVGVPIFSLLSLQIGRASFKGCLVY